MPENKKTTAPIPVVGAAGGQSSGRETISIIPKDSVERNRRNGCLATVSMTELYDTAYPPKAVLIDNLLYAGTYLFVGAPKIGKSFFMAQLSYHIATGAICGSILSIRARSFTSPWRTISPGFRSGCTKCLARRIRKTCILLRSPCH